MYICFSPTRDITCVLTSSQWEADFFAALGYQVADYNYPVDAK